MERMNVMFGKKDIKATKIGITGMSCNMCANRMRKAFEDTKGVEKADINLETNSADVTYDASKLDIDALKKIVTEAGYTPE